MSSKAKRKFGPSDYIVLTEILFIILPLIIVVLLDFSKGSYLSIFDRADWSYCTVLFSGQLIIKLVSALLKKQTHHHSWQFVALLLTIIIILLVFSVIFIVCMQDKNVKLWLKIGQVVLFFASVYIYFEIAGYAQEKDDSKSEVTQ